MFYNLGIQLYGIFIKVAAFFGNEKAKLWLSGRQDLWSKLADFQSNRSNKKVAWVHCASLGEFEQGRFLIEKIATQYTDYQVVVSFFSSSGYEIRKDYALASLVCYMPLDTKKNATRFVETLNPDVVYFVKYEFWFHHLNALKERNIPTYCVSAVFREQQVFFKWYGGFFRRILACFTQIFVQDETSKILLQHIDIQSIVTGDTRIDRVQDHARSVKNIPFIFEFLGHKKAFIAGSTWPKDEALLASLFDDFPKGYKLIVAPHEIDESHILNIVKLFNIKVLRYSGVNEKTIFGDFEVLIIDNIGMLSSLYQYGEIAYIGGGFGKGIHNTLEPLAFGLPVLIGPNYQKFTEAVELSKPNRKAIFSIQNEVELRHTFAALQQPDVRNVASSIALDFINQNSGATNQILRDEK